METRVNEGSDSRIVDFEAFTGWREEDKRSIDVHQQRRVVL